MDPLLTNNKVTISISSSISYSSSNPPPSTLADGPRKPLPSNTSKVFLFALSIAYLKVHLPQNSPLRTFLSSPLSTGFASSLLSLFRGVRQPPTFLPNPTQLETKNPLFADAHCIHQEEHIKDYLNLNPTENLSSSPLKNLSPQEDKLFSLSEIASKPSCIDPLSLYPNETKTLLSSTPTVNSITCNWIKQIQHLLNQGRTVIQFHELTPVSVHQYSFLYFSKSVFETLEAFPEAHQVSLIPFLKEALLSYLQPWFETSPWKTSSSSSYTTYSFVFPFFASLSKENSFSSPYVFLITFETLYDFFIEPLLSTTSQEPFKEPKLIFCFQNLLWLLQDVQFAFHTLSSSSVSFNCLEHQIPLLTWFHSHPVVVGLLKLENEWPVNWIHHLQTHLQALEELPFETKELEKQSQGFDDIELEWLWDQCQDDEEGLIQIVKALQVNMHPIHHPTLSFENEILNSSIEEIRWDARWWWGLRLWSNSMTWKQKKMLIQFQPTLVPSCLDQLMSLLSFETTSLCHKPIEREEVFKEVDLQALILVCFEKGNRVTIEKYIPWFLNWIEDLQWNSNLESNLLKTWAGIYKKLEHFWQQTMQS